MATIAVAGASGMLGREVARELVRRGHAVRALHRRGLPEDLAPLGARVDLATELPDLDGVDVVFSAVGASVDLTTLRGWRGYPAVDTPLNLRLLDAAERARVPRMVYVAVAGHEKYRSTPYVAAHEAVIERMRASTVAASVVRATGFFSAFDQFLKLARLRVLPNPGGGRARTNPIHDLDLAAVCADVIEGGDAEVSVGGPDVLTRRELLELAARSVGVGAWLVPVPVWMARAGALAMRPFHPRIAQFGSFVAALASADSLAPATGTRRLEDYFRERVARKAVD